MTTSPNEPQPLEIEEYGEELSPNHPFRWETVQADAKGAHQTVCSRGDWHKTMTYSVLDTNGFLLLYTLRGRVYWLTQNTTYHTTPDWKIHFSVIAEDIPQAWNILANLFMEMKCEIGMKATTAAVKFCASKQRGRELTVYVYVYDAALKSGLMYETSELSGNELYLGNEEFPEADFYLGDEFTAAYPPSFWLDFITTAEQRFQAMNIRSNGGVAEGDLPLPNCRYASLRNEAFVIEDRAVGLQYPSNAASWNAAKHKNPMEETIYLLLLHPPHAQQGLVGAEGL